ncbi:DNA-3-methyladenine glycosylase I [Fusobacterium sp. oral taxon 370]|uniref:DNA-3-methyladenine glycosylase I n=1 Tax=uncultured Fusobacterium sp. TaxID=159267 RepID=UPI000682982A
MIRCDWANKSELEQKYHDEEWAVPVHDDKKVEELLKNEGVIRNKLKINAVITNAKEYFKLCEEFGSLDKYLWAYVNNKPIKNSWAKIEEVPARTELSDKISKDLKKRSFKFVGSIIIYAFM